MAYTNIQHLLEGESVPIAPGESAATTYAGCIKDFEDIQRRFQELRAADFGFDSDMPAEAKAVVVALLNAKLSSALAVPVNAQTLCIDIGLCPKRGDEQPQDGAA